MKKILVLFILAIMLTSVHSQRNWNLHTNTTHMRDMVVFNDQIAISTWGGVEFFDVERNGFIRTLTSMNGLKGNNVLTLANLDNHELMMAVSGQGIERLINNRLHITLKEGLPSTRIGAIHVYEDLIFIGSDRGLTYFQKYDEIPFPLFKETFNDSPPYNMPFTHVNGIVSDDEGYIYLGTNRGFSMVHVDSLYNRQSWHHYTIGADVAVNSIDKKENIIVLATTHGLIHFEKENINNTSLWNRFSEDSSFAQVKIDMRDSAYVIYGVIGTWNPTMNSFTNEDRLNRTVLIVDNHQQSFLTMENDSFRKPVTSILIHNNRVYATTWGNGIYVADIANMTQWINIVPNTIHSNYISAIEVDNYGNMWFADGVPRMRPSEFSSRGVSTLNRTTGNWTHFDMNNSGLLTNNVTTIGVDSDNKKWFGSWFMDLWGDGISVLDDSSPSNHQWSAIRSGLWNNTQGDIIRVGNHMWIATDGNSNINGGMNIININDFTDIKRFQPPGVDHFAMTTAHRLENISVFGTLLSGVRLWNSSTEPVTGGAHWQIPTALRGIERVVGIDSWITEHSTQIWIVSSLGVYYMEIRGNNVEYYHINTSVRRQRWDGNRNTWDNATPAYRQFYFEHEQRLFGAEPTTPTSLVVDPFGRVWIGTDNKGLSMYDSRQDRFFNFRTRDSDIASDKIRSLAYNPITGLLYIGTTEGLVTLEIGRSEKTATELAEIRVFPNPFRPLPEGVHNSVIIQNVGYDSTLIGNPIGANECRIFDVSGQLIKVLQENRFMEFEWDGTNSAGRKVSSGIYFYLIKTEVGDSARGRIVLIR
jgi:ligand-binding sensor domain-containing protein